MKIFVCIKQVPDPNTTISKLDPATKRLVRTGVSLVLDPGDESTISAAIKLRDTLGNSEVVAVSMGPEKAQEGMRRALAMGADRAILVTDPALAGSDAISTARVLAAVLKKESADLIFCSTESTDGYTGMVPAASQNSSIYPNSHSHAKSRWKALKPSSNASLLLAIRRSKPHYPRSSPSPVVHLKPSTPR